MNVARKILIYTLLTVVLGAVLYIVTLYYWSYSTGERSGELIKFSNRGYIFKTWEGELSQGMAGNKTFTFSVMDNQENVIKQLRENQGKFVKLEYSEKLGTFAWWGDTKYFIVKVTPEKSPYFNNK
jgi:sensor domain CHASE-containing protein